MRKQLYPVGDYFYKDVHFNIHQDDIKLWWVGEINGKKYGNAIGKKEDEMFTAPYCIEIYLNALATIDAVKELQTV